MGSKQARPVLEKLRIIRGNKCLQCGDMGKLDFAHVRPTGISGNSRGMDKRMRDIRHHPNDYILLCRKCHLVLDSLHKNLTIKRGGGYLEKSSPQKKEKGKNKLRVKTLLGL